MEFSSPSVEPPGAASRQVNLRAHIEPVFDDVCTGCQYCLPCPEGIPIPRYMDVYDTMQLSGDDPEEARNQFKWYWGMTEDLTSHCTACGNCEARCTQHLNIIERLQALPALTDD